MSFGSAKTLNRGNISLNTAGDETICLEHQPLKESLFRFKIASKERTNEISGQAERSAWILYYS